MWVHTTQLLSIGKTRRVTKFDRSELSSSTATRGRRSTTLVMYERGGNDIGDRFAKRVVVDAVLDDPAPSGDVSTDFEVHIVNGTIEKVVPASGNFDFANAQENFIVLER